MKSVSLSFFLSITLPPPLFVKLTLFFPRESGTDKGEAKAKETKNKKNTILFLLEKEKRKTSHSNSSLLGSHIRQGSKQQVSFVPVVVVDFLRGRGSQRRGADRRGSSSGRRRSSRFCGGDIDRRGAGRPRLAPGPSRRRGIVSAGVCALSEGVRGVEGGCLFFVCL